MWDEWTMMIKAQIALSEKLLAIAKQQRKCMLGGDRGQMNEIMKAQENAFRQLAQIEHRKQSLLMENSRDEWQENECLTQLLREAPGKQRHQVLKHLEEMKEVTEKLRALNQENKKLLDNEARFIEFNINLMTQTTADDIYAPQGQSGSVISKKKMFDQTI